MAGRRARGTIAAVGLALLLAGTLVIGTPAAAQKATGGTGRFLQAIEWFSWGAHNDAIPAGGLTRTNSYTIAGQTFSVTCAVSSIAGGALSAYRPGSWTGDGLDELYNIGGTGTSNQLVVGLANAANGTNITFNLSCSAALGATPIPLAGLVMADAEQSGSANEWVGATIPAGATWRIIDRYRTPGCSVATTAQVSTVGGGSRLELGRASGTCAAGPMAVAFMDGATSASNVTVKGGGKSAIALGVMLNVDYGDAPASYGDAGALVQYPWTGGVPPTGTTDVSATGFVLANSVQPSVRLGATVDADAGPMPSASATGDDTSGQTALGGPDDEQVTVPGQIVVQPGQAYTLAGVACNGGGVVAGWIDWNRDGDFADVGERSANATCSGSSVDLTWSSMPSAAVTGPSFIRLRTATVAGEILAPTGVSNNGEVEDHAVRLVALPRLTLVKNVVGRVQAADQFQVTMAGPGIPGAGVSATTTGSATSATTSTQVVQPGQTYTLTDAKVAGPGPLGDYTATIRCVDAAASDAAITVLGAAPNWSVANLAVDQDVRCTITNTAKPASLDVVKTAGGAATGPAADGSYTVTHTVTVTNSGPSATTYGPLVDTPTFASNLVVDGAAWTTAGSGAPAPGTATGSGPFTLASGATIAGGTTHTFVVTLTFHFTNPSAATGCTGAAGGGLYDRVALPAGQEQGPTGNNTACTPPPTPPAPAITIDKTAGSVTDLDGNGADAGDTIEFAFLVENTGDLTLDPVVIADPQLGSLPCADGALAPGASRPCGPVTYTLTQTDVESGRIDNTATVTGTPPHGPAVTDTDSTSTPIPSNPAITIDKSAGGVNDLDGNGADVGDTIAYTFLVRNTGNRPLSSVGVSDPKVGAVTCPTTSLAPGASTSCTATYTLTQADVDAGGVVNTATVAGTPPGGSPVTGTDSDTRTFAASSALVLDKTADPLVDLDGNGPDAGDRITYRFVVSNTGATTLNPVTVNDPRVGGAVACGSGPLAPGASRTCSTAAYTLTQGDVESGAVTNTATATGTPPSGPAATSTDWTSTAILSNPKIDLVKTAAAPTDVNASGLTDAGDTIAYAFTITNLGNRPLDPVTISDPKLGPVTCASGPLAPGATRSCGPVVYTVTAADVDAAAVVNVATASGTAPNGQVVTASDDTATPTRRPAPALQIAKDAAAPTDVNGSGLTDAGDTIVYTFTVTNTGNVPIRDVAVLDPKVGAVACAATTLAPGASTSCSTRPLPAGGPVIYTVTVDDVVHGSVDNSATATGTNPDNGPVASPPDTTSTPTTTPVPALQIEKQAGPPTDGNGSGLTDSGDTIEYTFTVTNTGNVPVDDVVIVDGRFPDGVPCAATSLAVGAATTCGPVTYEVTDADEDAGRVDNSATARGTDPDGGTVTSPPDTTSTPTTTPAPGLAIDKQTVGTPADVNGNGITDAGDTIIYTFTVTNIGNVPMHDVGVDDPTIGLVTCAATLLAPGEATTCTPDTTPYTITGGDQAAGKVVNRATAVGLDPDDDPYSSPEDGTTTPTTSPLPRLTLVKTADAPVDVNGSELVDGGDTIQYRFTVTNSGNVPVNDVTVVDPDAGTVTCTPTTLAPGGVAVCAADAVYTISAADVDDGRVLNQATAEGDAPGSGTVTSNVAEHAQPTTRPEPSLHLRKSVSGWTDTNGSGLVDAGDVIDYTIRVMNSGNVTVDAIAVDDGLPGATTPVCPATALERDASMDCTVTYTVQEGDEGGEIVNTATATGLDPDDGAVDSPPSTATQPVDLPTPRFVVDKSVASVTDGNDSGLTDSGDEIQYAFAVTNTGNVPLRDIEITDDRLTPSTFTCTAGPVPPGVTVPCAAVPPYVVTEADEDAGAVVNVATGTGDDPDGDPITFPEDPMTDPPATTTTDVTRPDPKLVLTKVAGAPADVNGSGITDAGDTIDYTFSVRNAGNVPITAVTVTDPRAGTVTCAASTLPVGESTECRADEAYTVTLADEQRGSAANVAFAAGDDPDGDEVRSNDATTTTPTTLQQPNLRLVKTAGVPTDVNGSGLTDAGDTIQYAFRVTNTGNVPLADVRIDDEKLGLSGFVCTPGPIAPGATAACAAVPVYVVTEADEAAHAATNLASAVGTDPDGDPVEFPRNPDTDPPATTTTPVTPPQPALVLVKTAGVPDDVNGNGLVDAGDTIRYTFTVTNTGNVPVAAVAVADPKVGSVTCAPLRLLPTQSADCVADQPYAITQAEVDAGGEVVNLAGAAGVDPDGADVVANDSGTDTPADQAPALRLVKRAGAIADANGSGRVDAGDTIPFTFTVTNAGTVTVTAVAVQDPAVGAVTCPATALAPGASATCTAATRHTITQAEVNAGSFTNVARATAVAPNDETVTSNQATVTTPIAAQPGLAIAKTARLVDGDGDGRADVGETIDYTFVVRNTGSVSLTGVTVVDPMLAGAGEPVTCPVSALAPGASTTCRAAHVVRAVDIVDGVIRNTATASARAPGGTVVASAESSTSTGAESVSPPPPPDPEPEPPQPEPELPATGSDALVWSQAALALLAVGVHLLVVARRRRRVPAR